MYIQLTCSSCNKAFNIHITQVHYLYTGVTLYTGTPPVHRCVTLHWYTLSPGVIHTKKRYINHLQVSHTLNMYIECRCYKYTTQVNFSYKDPSHTYTTQVHSLHTCATHTYTTQVVHSLHTCVTHTFLGQVWNRLIVGTSISSFWENLLWCPSS